MTKKLSKITGTGKKFIEYVCEKNFDDLMSGKNGPMPYSYDENNIIVDKTWVSKASYLGKQITDHSMLSTALIKWFEDAADESGLDPNILAAQAYVESGYKLWYYSKKSNTKGGISQLAMEDIYALVVNDFGGSDPAMNVETDVEPIIIGLEDGESSTSYQPVNKNSDTQLISKKNRPILHQNIIDNPRIMIKAQAKYMKYFADNCNKLASTSLFCYNRGAKYMSGSYTRTIDLFKQVNGDQSNNNNKLVLGLDYVLKVFGVLGDKDNRLKKYRKYKPTGKYFSYDDLFKYNGGDDLVDNPNVNENFDAFVANVRESESFGVSKNTLDKLSITLDSRYKFIYFPEDKYFNNKIINKEQIVLHHTVSGDGDQKTKDSGVSGDIKHWKSKGEGVATSFILTREGNIYQLFNTDFWGYHLGIIIDKIYLNSHSIGIEIDSWGGLIKYNGKWYPTSIDNNKDMQTFVRLKNSKSIPDENVQVYDSSNDYPNGFRGFFGFEKYTKEQIKSVRDLILSIVKGNDSEYKGKYPNIDLKFQDTIWNIDYDGNGVPIGSANGGIGTSKTALGRASGIWSHTSFRGDKSDCHPQPELVKMLRNLDPSGNDTNFNSDFAKNKK